MLRKLVLVVASTIAIGCGSEPPDVVKLRNVPSIQFAQVDSGVTRSGSGAALVYAANSLIEYNGIVSSYSIIPKSATLDFEKKTALVLVGPTKSTGGYSAEVLSVDKANRILVVNAVLWRLSGSGVGIESAPYCVVSIDKTDFTPVVGEVVVASK